MDTQITIRDAKPTDAESILAIYRPIVLETAISFETEVPTRDEMAARIESYSKTHAYLVACHDDLVVGYAYGSQFRPRAAYARSAEVTVYVHEDNHGQGIGRILYQRLLKELSGLGYHRALAAITLPNEASVALHERFGFEKVGVLQEVGEKFERWHDVGWWQKPLGVEEEA